VVYLSQHWFVDVLAGMALATVAWWGVGRFLDRGARKAERGARTTIRLGDVEPSPRGRGQGEGAGVVLHGEGRTS